MVTSGVELRVSAAILAGGRARRFGGADKAALRIGSERILDRQLAALSGVADDVRIVGGGSNRHAGLAVRVIADAIPNAGPLGGIYTALLDAGHDRVLVLACDLPFVTRGLLARIAAAGDDRDDAVMPRSSRGLEPLCAWYHRRAGAAIRAQIERGALSVHTLVDVLRVREMQPEALAPFAGDEAFENVNTPHDYERARRSIELDMKPMKDRITE
jgi:molybdopterin-guanine dinucleotide biosynthesis protein A